MNNLKQIGNAIAMYINDYDEYWPPAHFPKYGSLGTWIIGVAPYLGYTRPGNVADDFNYRNWLKSKKNVFYCPSSFYGAKRKFPAGAITYEPTTHNRFGPRGGGWIRYGDSNGAWPTNPPGQDAATYWATQPRRYSKIVQESIVLFECIMNSDGQGLPLTDFYNLPGYVERIQVRHSAFANYLFADFHVEA
ncbi:MAG: DUF1559 domain-containing protein, partial [Candidatus Omnitrophica bacterium]|nr:DUF1559 domain-containing protein [Candidatus Omnitrophota bacterium]